MRSETTKLQVGWLKTSRSLLVPESLRGACPPAESTVCRTACSAHRSQAEEEIKRWTGADSSRRQLMLAGAAFALAPVVLPGLALADDGKTVRTVLGVNNLSTFQRRAQKQQIKDRAARELKKVLTPGDANLALRLVFNDAGTYDVATDTGGVDGSVFLDEELKRPENQILKPLVAKLAKAKKAIDEQGAVFGQGPISWADLGCLAVREATMAEWRKIKISRAPVVSGGETIADAFGSPFEVALGRIDSGVPSPAGRIPGDDASLDEIHAYLTALGNKNPEGGFGKPKPPFWERPSFVLWTAAQADPEAAEQRFSADPRYAGYKKKYDMSRRTVTRSEYEVDFAEYFYKLANLGAKFDKDAYLYSTVIQLPKLS
ncbi:hypothetical protein WJX72_007826 [[Myrmecia] bisecta]|uniref:Plant heme peroxidase family profile domain-containing protein n=1 Tax=[Myrmecia] bisecta TaxID=41462 RepID=A0AAW1PKF8_9CHLO